MRAMTSEGGTAAARVLALVPAHDEAPRIAAVVREATRHLPVFVVDDGSSDGTAAVARQAGANALRAGCRLAVAEGFDAVVALDADGQHDPAEIPAFLAALAAPLAPGAAPPDLVVGRRDFRRMPPLRRVANVLGGRAISWAVGTPVPDNQSGYRLVGRRLMEAALASTERGFELEVEMLATCIARGWPVAWVPIRTIYAGEPSHIRPASHVRNFFRAVGAARRAVRAARQPPGG